MAKEICISSTPHETRLAILEDDQLAEIYYERENEYTLAGSIYKGRVTRVLPGMQSAFVDIGLERDAFLYVTDFLEEQEDSEDFERLPAPRQQQQQAPQQRQQSSSPAPVAAAPAQQAPAQHAPAEAAEDEEGDENRGTRRWRGRRGRRRGLRGRIQPEAVEAAPNEVEAIEIEPVEFAEAEAETGHFTPNEAAATPFVLPGESLSKYGGAPKDEHPEAGAAAPSRPAVTAKPSTLVEAPLPWDGGFLLPGESLSRHRAPAGSQTQTLSQPAPQPEAESHPAAQPEAVHTPEPVPAPVIEQPRIEAAPIAAATEEIGEESAVTVDPAAEVAAEPVAAVPFFEEVETVEEEHEFEPEEASASYRVDPAAPSEFRVSSAEFDEEPGHSEEEVVMAAPEAAAQAFESPTFESQTFESPTFESEIEPEGEADDEAEDESEDESGDSFETGLAQTSREGQSPADIYGFAPGAGVFEEEVIDEEEFDFEPLHATALDEHEDELEEETLDQTAQLSDMVRDMHLEERLAQPEPESEGDDEDESGFAPAETNESFEDEGDDVDEDGPVSAPAAEASSAPARRESRRFDRRGGGRGRQGGGRQRHGGDRGGRRPSAQTMELPIISELLKQGQEILVQIAKEPIAKKGARITSHIALPGRFLVFMPTVNHVGVSRKISSDEERQRLKRILISEKGTATGGFIVRTAAEGAGEDELRADIRFLINLWSEIKDRSENGKAPALIYHDLNLIERILRDQVSEDFSTIWVDSEVDYERIVRFLNRFQPSLVRRVKLYTKETPLFEQFGIQDEIGKALKSKVWLKSGGSIVINQTEALVAIDINTGKYVGKTARLEDTIVKTNLDAIPEIVRQIRLRDLGGIIVIDFIDMDERKNRHKVLQALEDELKADRAPSKVLQFNDFGLVAITRKRVKQSLERTLSTPCTICTGTGMVKSPTTVANEIFIEMRKMQRHLERNDILLRVNPEVVKTLKTNGARWLNELEEMTGKTIIVKSDPTLHPEQFDIH
jgi:Rne/Rng family ribonuclease